MKFALLLLAVCGLACGSAIPAPAPVAVKGLSKSLYDDFAEFIAFIPRGEIINILVEYLATDEEVQEIVIFLASDEFSDMVVAVNGEPSFLAILDYLEENGVAIYDFLNTIYDFLGIPSIVRPPTVTGRGQKGWRDMWNDLVATLPLSDMYQWHCGKLANGSDWKILYDSLQDQVFRDMLNAFRVTDSWQAVVAKLAEYGVETELVVSAIQKFFNWDDDNIDYCVNYIPPQ